MCEIKDVKTVVYLGHLFTVPNWINYMAIDGNGNVNGYDVEPYIVDENYDFWSYSNGDFECVGFYEYEGNWKESLREVFEKIPQVSQSALGTIEMTNRGFEVVKFIDYYNTRCSLQASSLAHYEKPGTSAVWLGCDDAAQKVMASQAKMLGVATQETCGWVPYPIPEEVQLTTRMHLTREQVAALITHLQNWLDNDSFVTPNIKLSHVADKF